MISLEAAGINHATTYGTCRDLATDPGDINCRAIIELPTVLSYTPSVGYRPFFQRIVHSLFSISTELPAITGHVPHILSAPKSMVEICVAEEYVRLGRHMVLIDYLGLHISHVVVYVVKPKYASPSSEVQCSDESRILDRTLKPAVAGWYGIADEESNMVHSDHISDCVAVLSSLSVHTFISASKSPVGGRVAFLGSCHCQRKLFGCDFQASLLGLSPALVPVVAKVSGVVWSELLLAVAFKSVPGYPRHLDVRRHVLESDDVRWARAVTVSEPSEDIFYVFLEGKVSLSRALDVVGIDRAHQVLDTQLGP